MQKIIVDKAGDIKNAGGRPGGSSALGALQGNLEISLTDTHKQQHQRNASIDNLLPILYLFIICKGDNGPPVVISKKVARVR